MANIHGSPTSESSISVASDGGMVMPDIRVESGFSIFCRSVSTFRKVINMQTYYFSAFESIVDVFTTVLQLGYLTRNCGKVLLESRKE